MADFKIIKPEEINENTFSLIGKDWMLITSGNNESFNTMTASWGGFGILWHKKVFYIFIRPQRYTYEFIEKNDIVTLSFFDDKFRDVLNFCGSNSGRDVDKITETGITPVKSENGSVYFSESKLVVEGRKIYFQDLDPGNFLDSGIEDNYPGKDYHRMYICEIISCLGK